MTSREKEFINVVIDHLREMRSSTDLSEWISGFELNDEVKKGFVVYIKPIIKLLEPWLENGHSRENVFDIGDVARAYVREEIDLAEPACLPCVKPPYPITWMFYKIGRDTVGVALVDTYFGESSVLFGTTFVRPSNVDKESFLLRVSFILTLNKKGRADSSTDKSRAFLPPLAPGINKEEAGEFLNMSVFISLNAISLIHAKGVEVQKPKQISSKAQRKRRKKGKHPLVRYKTLKIIKTTDDGGRSHQNAGSSGPRAKHTVRGHFVDYSKGPGMFGNPELKGVYWKPPHLSGDADNGVVVKDYTVEAGKRNKPSS